MSPSPSPPPGEEAALERGPLASSVATTDDRGWVTARPPGIVEVFLRVVMFPVTMWRNRDLVGTSVKRELESRFQGTLLGWAWPLVSPLFTFAVYYFIFTKLLAMKFPGMEEDQKTVMGIFMFTGVLVWSAFGESLLRSCNVIVDNSNVIKKLVFPAELLPLNLVAVGLVTMLFGLGVYLLAVFLTPVWVAPDPVDLCWIPLLLFLQGVFTYGLALFLSALNVFLRDTAQVIAILVTVWMFLTPIFWAPEIIGDDIEPYLGVVMANPVYYLVYAWRWVLMHQEPDILFAASDIAPTLQGSVATFSYWAVGTFVFGYAFFIVCQRRFADEV